MDFLLGFISGFMSNFSLVAGCFGPIHLSCIYCRFFLPLPPPPPPPPSDVQARSRSCFLYDYSCCESCVLRLWGIHMLCICLDGVLPKVTLNPIHSPKSMYYTVYFKGNNDHYGDSLPLGC